MPATEFVSIAIPGLIVVDKVILWKYVPFAEAGFSLATTLIISASVVPDFIGREGSFSNAHMNDTLFINFEVDFTGFYFFHRFTDF